METFTYEVLLTNGERLIFRDFQEAPRYLHSKLGDGNGFLMMDTTIIYMRHIIYIKETTNNAVDN